MALFQKSTEKSAAKDRDNAQANLSRLAAKLSDAEQAVIACKTTSQACALSGDDGGLDKMEAAERAAQHRHSTLSAAHGEAGKLLAALESQFAALVDQRVRAATSAATTALAAELAEAGLGFDASVGLLGDVCARALLITAEANGLSIFSRSARVEVSAAVAVIAEELRQHARAVTNRIAPAEMPKPAAEPAKVVPIVKEKLVTVFATRACRWRDADGAERACGKFVDIDVPAATAKRALACGAALELSNPARKANLGTWPGHVSLPNCFDLDKDQTGSVATPQHDPVVHAAFTQVDRGKPFQLRVAGSTS